MNEHIPRDDDIEEKKTRFISKYPKIDFYFLLIFFF